MKIFFSGFILFCLLGIGAFFLYPCYPEVCGDYNVWAKKYDQEFHDTFSEDEYELYNHQPDMLDDLPISKLYIYYTYHTQVLRPSYSKLAIYLAKKGKSTAYFILSKIEGSKNDLDYRDFIIVISYMVKGSYYDACGDEFIMNKMIEHTQSIENKGWNEFYEEQLSAICSLQNKKKRQHKQEHKQGQALLKEVMLPFRFYSLRFENLV